VSRVSRDDPPQLPDGIAVVKWGNELEEIAEDRYPHKPALRASSGSLVPAVR